MKKAILILIIAILFYTGFKSLQRVNNLPKTDLTEVNLDQKMLMEDIMKEAKAVLDQKITDDEDLSSGPCLLNPSTIDKDWVVDIAHNPRTPEDDKPENQCSSYLEKQSSHFIEVDESGNLIRFN